MRFVYGIGDFGALPRALYCSMTNVLGIVELNVRHLQNIVLNMKNPPSAIIFVPTPVIILQKWPYGGFLMYLRKLLWRACYI